MERSYLLELMGELKLYGMKAAFDEIMATAMVSWYLIERACFSLISASSEASRGPAAACGGGHPKSPARRDMLGSRVVGQLG